jgi:hypothetical protein
LMGFVQERHSSPSESGYEIGAAFRQPLSRSTDGAFSGTYEFLEPGQQLLHVNFSAERPSLARSPSRNGITSGDSTVDRQRPVQNRVAHGSSPFSSRSDLQLTTHGR